MRTKPPRNERKPRTRGNKIAETPLAFDSLYLKKMGNAPQFMNNDDIMTWIKSVSHHLKSWYFKSVCSPANEAYLRAAQRNPIQFANAVAQNEPEPYKTANIPGGPYEGVTEEDVASDFVQYAWRTVGYIERDGQRAGAFGWSKKGSHIRYAAIMLLVSVIMDLTVNMGYFVRLFLSVIGTLTAEDERILLALGGDSSQRRCVLRAVWTVQETR